VYLIKDLIGNRPIRTGNFIERMWLAKLEYLQYSDIIAVYMTKETKAERISAIPSQVYSYKNEILSVSLGQGTREINPEPPLSLLEMLDKLDKIPNDKWMWSALPTPAEADIPQLVKRLDKPSSALLHVLTPFLGQKKYQDLVKAVLNIDKELLIGLVNGIPELSLRTRIFNPSALEIERAWNKVRTLNREQLVPVSGMGNIRLPYPESYEPKVQETEAVPVRIIKDVYDRQEKQSGQDGSRDTGTSLRDKEIDETVNSVTENPVLEKAIGGQTLIGRKFCGTCAIAIPWTVDWVVNLDRANYRVLGSAGVSGKGMTVEATTASAFMELAERVSAVAGATENWPDGYKFIGSLVKAKFSELKSANTPVMDPNDFFPSVPYMDQEIYWVKADLLPYKGNEKPTDILVPAQKVFHCMNLDEPEILRDTSNGLASGNTPEEARLHALLEIIERDGCYTIFTSPERQFTFAPDANDPLGNVISLYHAKGLDPAFIDITSDLGVPAYKAYLQLPDGRILSGSGAHLNGRIALNRAICELGAKCMGVTAHSGRLTCRKQQVQIREFTDIPNLSTGSVKDDLILTEAVLKINGFPVIYADLTRNDVNIPVVRAIVPGLDSPFSLTKREVRHFAVALQTG
jgi:ribosomal protein S12 methylthiotransferase accessory factor YcaO